MLDAKSERALAQLTEQMRAAFGPDLVSVVLYGSAAGDDFVPGRSDLNFAIVLERVTFPLLKVLHRYLPQWHKLGMAMPLLLDRPFLSRARDAFPMEFHDIKAQHRVLYGESVIANLTIDTRHLRYQAEHEARSKLLRLRGLYAEVGADPKGLPALMIDSVKTFVIIMRNFIRLQGGAAHSGYIQVLDQFERHTNLSFPTMRLLVRVRLGVEPWPETIDRTFAAYLEEVERLVNLIDRTLPETEAATPAAHN